MERKRRNGEVLDGEALNGKVLDRKASDGKVQDREARDRKAQNGRIWFWAGICLMALMAVPALILGEDAIITYHDQLDVEVIGYLLHGRHLFSGDMLPEFMGGSLKTALTMPAPLCVLLFLGENVPGALLVMQLVGRLTGFAGMYLLSRELTGHAWIGGAAGALYGLLPYLPVYGLSLYGVPMLVWCALELRKGRHKALSYCYTVFFGMASSLVLSGFALLGLGALLFFWDLCRRRRPWHFLGAWLVLLSVYVAEDFQLLGQMLGWGEQLVSHKSERVVHGMPFWETLRQWVFVGVFNGEGYQELLLPVLLGAVPAALLAVWVLGKKKADFSPGLVHDLKYACLCLGCGLFLALMSALWDSSWLEGLRRAMGTLGAFQADRCLWAAPCLWHLAFACGAAALWELWRCCGGARRLAAGCGLLAMGLAAGATGVRVLLLSDTKSNLQKLRNPEYDMISYKDYYAIGVLEQVRDFLKEQTGLAQEEYRVVSLGIDPAAAYYHGFYCLDGYSNNYALAHKHAFRKVIGPELEKNEYLRVLFDEWGNRCYLFSSECPNYITVEKHGFFFQNYELDAGALRDMGCDWLLSAAYIQNAESQGLVLMREEPFETEDSYYAIYVYGFADPEEEP